MIDSVRGKYDTLRDPFDEDPRGENREISLIEFLFILVVVIFATLIFLVVAVCDFVYSAVKKIFKKKE